jgi:diadenosine tetraphosphate (Ap4A) HIT family hydrolase
MDIFCQIKTKLTDQIIDETKNFYILHDGFPLIEGHLLLIPKKHCSCYLTMDLSLRQECSLLKNQIVRFLSQVYTAPVIFEHGEVGQTVEHMHLHFLPTKKSLLPYLQKKANFLKKEAIPYLYYEEKNQQYYFLLPKILPGMLHSILFADLLNRPREGKERLKEAQVWLLKVKDKYALWKKK